MSLKTQKIKLLFNPQAGKNKREPTSLIKLLQLLQAWRFNSEVLIITEDIDFSDEIQQAFEAGHRFFVICGGDGTVSSTVRELIGKDVKLGIIPNGTQNNTALSLGIPRDIADSVPILRTGQVEPVDIGLVTINEKTIPFLEFCSIGLVSSVFPSADDIQHGDLTKIQEFISKLISSPEGAFSLKFDGGEKITYQGNVAVFSNLPFVALNFQAGQPDAYKDGKLEMHLFDQLNKIELINIFIQSILNGKLEDQHIIRQEFKSLELQVDPVMPVLVDGIQLGKGNVHVEIQPNAIQFIVPSQQSDKITPDERNG